MDAILSAVRGHLLAIQSMAADVHAVVAASTAGGLGLLFGATDSADSSSSSGSGASRSLLQSTSGETAGMLYTLYVNVLLFIVIMTFFEANRYMKQIYLKRVKTKFEITQRVPPPPPRYFFGWIPAVMKVTEDDLLYMIGLDGYMFIRYIGICFKISVFFSFFGVLVLAPIYGTAGGGFIEWKKFTLANVVDGTAGTQLWAPAIFGYLFTFYFCYLMQSEYENFIQKRVHFLINGDPDTPPQTYYTVMLEHIPPALRSAPMLREFFGKLFPGDVYSVEVALDLSELDSLVNTRANIRDKLEKSIAMWNATGKRPSTYTTQAYHDTFVAHEHEGMIKGKDLSDLVSSDGEGPFGLTKLDAIEYYTFLLKSLNIEVEKQQKEYVERMERLDALDEARLKKRNPRSRAEFAGHYVMDKAQVHVAKAASQVTKRTAHMTAKLKDVAARAKDIAQGYVPTTEDNSSAGDAEPIDENATPGERVANVLRHSNIRSVSSSPFHDDFASMEESVSGLSIVEREDPELTDKEVYFYDDGEDGEEEGDGLSAELRAALKQGTEILNVAAKAANSGMKEVAKEGAHAVKIMGKGALRGVLEATRAVELLTIGAFYHTSSTAFVTFRSRMSKAISYQMLLSNKYYLMSVSMAPNPKDIIWANVSIPVSQINARRRIADSTLILGALFWSAIVASINGFSNLDALSSDVQWLQRHQDSAVYKIFNQYLAVLILLILLVLLPLIFDQLSRYYEGLKLESEIQNSIMSRYFYYQLANVFVTVGSGTIFASINQIFSRPDSVASILGENLPQVSIYFANLVIVRTFLGLPIEMLRIWPLLTILGVKTCRDRKKMTRRELRTGAFADPPMSYGWYYPQIMMVVMIVVTYSTIAPFLMPFGALFFAFCYVIYKYQVLYIFTNDYQSGGFDWYAVFNRTMVALICGALTLVGYLGLRQTYYSGPFYMTIPLPFAIVYFWYKCNSKYIVPSKALSLENAVELDHLNRLKKRQGVTTPEASFTPYLYRQPSLAEGIQHPESYRRSHKTEGGRQVSVASSMASIDLENGVHASLLKNELVPNPKIGDFAPSASKDSQTSGGTEMTGRYATLADFAARRLGEDADATAVEDSITEVLGDAAELEMPYDYSVEVGNISRAVGEDSTQHDIERAPIRESSSRGINYGSSSSQAYDYDGIANASPPSSDDGDNSGNASPPPPVAGSSGSGGKKTL